MVVGVRYWLAVVAVVLAVTGCGRDFEVTQPLADELVDSTGVARVTFSGDHSLMTVLGSTERLLVWARDSTDATVCGILSPGCAPWVLSERFQWDVDGSGIVSLQEIGTSLYPNGGARLTALAEGRVEITASVDDVADTMVVEVIERARIAWSVETLGASVGIAVAEDGTIYMAGSVGLQAVSPDGAVRWALPASVKALPAIAEDGTLYLGTGGGAGLMAIDPGGTVLWVTPIDDIWSPPVIGPDGTIYQGTSDGTLYAIDPTGEVLWQFDAPPVGALSRNRAPPAIAEDGTIYFGSEDHHLYALDPDGSERWRFPTEGPVRTPSIGVDGTIYFANDRIAEWSNNAGRIVHVDSRMFAVHPDGTERWSAPLEGDVWSGPAIGFDGSVYIGTINDGDGVYVFAPGGGLLRTVGGGAGHTPIVAGDGSIYRSLSVVSAFDADGTMRWTFEPENFASPVPAIGLDGRIYAAASDRAHVSRLYAFEELTASPGGWDAAPWPQDRGDRANTGRARTAPVPAGR
jgi:outer membrane protein assembly factor BamB